MYIYIHTHTTDTQAIAHHHPTNAQLAPQSTVEEAMNSPLQYSFHTMSYGMEYPPCPHSVPFQLLRPFTENSLGSA